MVNVKLVVPLPLNVIEQGSSVRELFGGQLDWSLMPSPSKSSRNWWGTPSPLDRSIVTVSPC